MPRVPEDSLARLDRAGLIWWNYSEDHVFKGGISVSKPASVPANNVPGYPTDMFSFDKPVPVLDAPSVRVYSCNDKWVLDAVQSCGGMGPADFYTEWDTADEAITDVLAFYFGDPTRMNLKAEQWLRTSEPIETTR